MSIWFTSAYGHSDQFFSQAWAVLTLFLIPIGGGIPGGVLLAKTNGFAWPLTSVLYLISDVILAIIFEPLLLLLISVAKRSPKLTQMGEAFKVAMKKTTSKFGSKTGPLALILISFGADPMTGRSAAVAAGHGFVTGWLFAITGDMFYFLVIMASTLWLNGILGDGTATTFIILVLMMGIPYLVERYRKPKLQ